MINEIFYYPITLHRDTSAGAISAPWVQQLPPVQEVIDSVCVLTQDEGIGQGVYTWDGLRFRFTLPYADICQAVIGGATINIYYDINTAATIPTKTLVWRNGVPYTDPNFTVGDGAVWAVLAYPLSAAGDVKTVNGQHPDGTGNVAVITEDANPATGTSLIVDNGALTGIVKLKTLVPGSGITLAADPNGNVQINGSNQYVLPTATSSTLGGVKIGSNVSVAPDGTISVAAPTPPYTLPIASSSTLGGVKIGANVNVAGDGTISVAAPYTLPIATASVLGGVKQGANVTIAADGTISASGAVQSVSGQTGTVVISTVDNNGATGTTLIADSGATTGTAKLKTLVPGTLIQFATDASGNLVISSTATSGALTEVNNEGTGTGLVDNNGTAGGIATIKSLAAGSNITITPSGDNKTLTIAANQVLNPATTSTIGGVIVGTGLNVDGTGKVSLAAPSGVNLGGVKAGTGITIAADGTISSTATGGVSSISYGTSGPLTGAISITAGPSISLSNTGNNVQISGTGVPEAPNDGNGYMRQNLAWAVVPSIANAITSITGQTGTGAVLLVESNPPANSAIIKSLVAGQNVTLSEANGLITVTAAIPAGTVSTVNGISPNGSGNVTLTASSVNAVPVAGNVTMTGPLDFGSQALTGLAAPGSPSAAIPLSYITALVIDGGVIG